MKLRIRGNACTKKISRSVRGVKLAAREGYLRIVVILRLILRRRSSGLCICVQGEEMRFYINSRVARDNVKIEGAVLVGYVSHLGERLTVDNRVINNQLSLCRILRLQRSDRVMCINRTVKVAYRSDSLVDEGAAVGIYRKILEGKLASVNTVCRAVTHHEELSAVGKRLIHILRGGIVEPTKVKRSVLEGYLWVCSNTCVDPVLVSDGCYREGVTVKVDGNSVLCTVSTCSRGARRTWTETKDIREQIKFVSTGCMDTVIEGIYKCSGILFINIRCLTLCVNGAVIYRYPVGICVCSIDRGNGIKGLRIVLGESEIRAVTVKPSDISLTSYYNVAFGSLIKVHLITVDKVCTEIIPAIAGERLLSTVNRTDDISDLKTGVARGVLRKICLGVCKIGYVIKTNVGVAENSFLGKRTVIAYGELRNSVVS